MKISIVVATDLNGVIGKDGKLPWHIPEDLVRFRQITIGHHVLMGRKTFESIGRPLAERKNLILSKSRNFKPEGVVVFEHLGDAITFARQRDEEELMVIGGEQIYRLTLPLAEKLYITSVLGEFEGDTRFPKYDNGGWMETGWEELSTVPRIVFRTLERR